MATINIDSKILEALQLSTCFGLAHDDTVPECKQCDVKGQCKAKSEGGVSVPLPTVKPKKASTTDKPAEKPKATSKSTTATTKSTTAKPKAPEKPKATPVASGDIPDFKPMTLEDLKSLAKDRNVEWKDYGNDQITRMRLIMALKKSY